MLDSNTTQPVGQKARIRAALLNGERLTAIAALDRFGCMRLAAVVHALRQSGLAVSSERVKTGRGATIAAYSVAQT